MSNKNWNLFGDEDDDFTISFQSKSNTKQTKSNTSNTSISTPPQNHNNSNQKTIETSTKENPTYKQQENLFETIKDNSDLFEEIFYSKKKDTKEEEIVKENRFTSPSLPIQNNIENQILPEKKNKPQIDLNGSDDEKQDKETNLVLIQKVEERKKIEIKNDEEIIKKLLGTKKKK